MHETQQDPEKNSEPEPKDQKQGLRLTRIQEWTRAAVVGLLFPLATSTAATVYIERSYDPVAPIAANDPESDTIPGTLYEEQARNPELTGDKYIDLLAYRLMTPEKLDQFFQKHFEYADDNAHLNSNRSVGRKGDYWQAPSETVRRVQRITRRSVMVGGGIREEHVPAMIGDCEDIAFLAEEILWRQGKVAHVVSLAVTDDERHATCVWIERRRDGRYNGYTLDQYGVDRNGGLLSLCPPVTSPAPDGFKTAGKAFGAVMAKYDEYAPGNPAFIPVARLRGPLRYIDAVPLQAFGHSSIHLPSYVDFLTAMGIFASGYAGYRFRKLRKEGETWKEYCTRFRVV